MADLIPITINIADRSYRIRVEPQDESTVRKTVKFINDKIAELKTAMAGKDMQDYVSMALIWFATQPANTDGSQHLTEEIIEGLQRLETLVDRGLGNQRADDEIDEEEEQEVLAAEKDNEAAA